MCVYEYACIPQYTNGNQRTTYGSQFFSYHVDSGNQPQICRLGSSHLPHRDILLSLVPCLLFIPPTALSIRTGVLFHQTPCCFLLLPGAYKLLES